ncbi:hypothetical protein NLX86_15170 [Streptomyces sp. A3M-1-3]|uniref:hypothetical protein n=1 Tax=Streptomyces sp. A3M-1-3 TaxID=2962044 RepID=UPI0020B7C195|nr:hypothetical protein [Streptomyces sp. A3M-1-3]MCP3819397.1 hypothetical protein [Streptomyces sp. A3M-1-3]
MRSLLSAVLSVLVAVLVPLSALAVWADREVGDTGRYVQTMAPLASDPAVQHAVAERVTVTILNEPIVKERIAKEIGAHPLRSGVERYLGEAVRSFVGTDAFRTAWNAANRAAHPAVEQVLSGGAGNTVTIDLAPVIEQVKRELAANAVPFADRIPVEHAEITVLESDQFDEFRKGFHVLQIAGVWLPVLTLLFAVGALAVAARRRRAPAATGLGLALGAALLWAGVVVGRRLSLDDLPPDVDRPAAGAVYDALTGFLRTTAWVILVLGLAVALGAWLGGRLRTGRPGGPVPERTETRTGAHPAAHREGALPPGDPGERPERVREGLHER